MLSVESVFIQLCHVICCWRLNQFLQTFLQMLQVVFLSQFRAKALCFSSSFQRCLYKPSDLLNDLLQSEQACFFESFDLRSFFFLFKSWFSFFRASFLFFTAWFSFFKAFILFNNWVWLSLHANVCLFCSLVWELFVWDGLWIIPWITSRVNDLCLWLRALKPFFILSTLTTIFDWNFGQLYDTIQELHYVKRTKNKPNLRMMKNNITESV